MRVVLDTNVVISRYLTPSSSAADIYSLWEAGQIDVLASDEILAEMTRVFAYDRLVAIHHLSATEIALVVAGFRQRAIVIDNPAPVRVVADDPDDDKFLACALAGRAEIIVCGDRHLASIRRYKDIEILTSRAFLAFMTAHPAPE